jgi:hypothetical protein
VNDDIEKEKKKFFSETRKSTKGHTLFQWDIKTNIEKLIKTTSNTYCSDPKFLGEK